MHRFLPWAILAICAAVAGAPKINLRNELTESCKPCEDFYGYVTQKWVADNPIPADQARWGQFNVLSDGNRERLKVILDDMVARGGSGKSVTANERKLGAYYSSCMDTARIESMGTQPVKAHMDLVAGIKNRKGLGDAIIALNEAGAGGPFALFALQDLKNPDEMIAWISPGGFSLPDRDNYFQSDERSKSMREQFLAHVTRMHELLGWSNADSRAAAKAVLDFETRLAEPTLTRVEKRDPYKISNRTDLEAVKKTAPSFDWSAMVQRFGLSASVPVNLSEPKHLAAFEKEFNGADLEVWKTYLRWRLIAAVADELPKAFDDEKFSFQKVLTGVKEQKARWKRCVDATDQLMGDALGEAFVKKHFPPAAKKRMDTLVSNLRETLAAELKSANWLSEETKAQALTKLSKIGLKIGYPEKWKDYTKLEMAGDQYYQNNRAASFFQLRRNLDKVGKPVDKTEWGMTPPTVNAYYSPVQNEIAFPAGILQPPFFDADADDALNYGGIGMVIGHEIGHGFDDQGSRFDATGKLRNWWTDSDRSKFDVRVQCIVDQFNNVEVLPGVKHNGKLVTGEALGDIGGVTLAFRAYQRSLGGKKSKVIDGLTGEQRFFVSTARVWASHARPEYLKLQVQTDPHPVAQYRVTETLRNMPEFHAAFGCKAGDAMVRAAEKQCRLW